MVDTSLPNRVSPAAGIRCTRQTRSIFTDPITTIGPGGILPPLAQLPTDDRLINTSFRAKRGVLPYQPPFVIRHSTFFRHWSFVIRHSHLSPPALPSHTAPPSSPP